MLRRRADLLHGFEPASKAQPFCTVCGRNSNDPLHRTPSARERADQQVVLESVLRTQKGS